MKITLLLALLMALFAASYAKPAPTADLPLQFDIGVQYFGGKKGGPLKKTWKGRGHRKYTRWVKFRKPFCTRPRVVVSIQQFDFHKKKPLIIEARVKKVNNKGFRMIMGTKLCSKLWSARVSWLAIV